VVTASATHNADLFWALRGAGFSFGIVTDFKFRTIAAPAKNFLFYIFFPWTQEQAIAGLLALQSYANSTLMPSELNMRVISVKLGGTLLWELQGVYHGSEDDCNTALAPILSQLGAGILYINSTLGWIDSLYYANNNGLVPLLKTGETLETPLDYDVVCVSKSFKSCLLTLLLA
jgi:hypothetical protein